MKYLFTLLCAMVTYTSVAQTIIAAKDAAKHLGETVTICDKVYSAKLITTSNMTY